MTVQSKGSSDAGTSGVPGEIDVPRTVTPKVAFGGGGGRTTWSAASSTAPMSVPSPPFGGFAMPVSTTRARLRWSTSSCAGARPWSITGLVPAGSIVLVGPPLSASAPSCGSTPVSVCCCVSGASPGAWIRLNALVNPPEVDVSTRSRSWAAPPAVFPATIVLVMVALALCWLGGLPYVYWLR